MPNFSIPNLPYISKDDQFYADAFRAIETAINTIAQQAGASASGVQSPPPKPTALTVSAAQGIHDIAIDDNAPVTRGIRYFLEYSQTPGFTAPIPIHLGPSRNHRANLGNQTFYWRAYSQYGSASDPSPYVYFGTPQNPTPVVGGGSSTGPVPLASRGSGTANNNGLDGGSGYGKTQTRGLPSL